MRLSKNNLKEGQLLYQKYVDATAHPSEWRKELANWFIKNAKAILADLEKAHEQQPNESTP